MKLSQCLADLSIADASVFEGCDDIGEEFKIIKKIYMRKVLAEHPVSSRLPFAPLMALAA